ncbi:MAG: hypothetical protein ACOCV2_14725 [Persicimonas sp.]
MDDESIRELCAEYGLRAESVRRTDEILIIVPQSLDELPDQVTLGRLVEALRATSEQRYITLAIDEVE